MSALTDIEWGRLAAKLAVLGEAHRYYRDREKEVVKAIREATKHITSNNNLEDLDRLGNYMPDCIEQMYLYQRIAELSRT